MKNYLLLLAALLTTITGFGQTFPITGMATDATDGLALIGAHVSLNDATSGQLKATVTDLDGSFQLEAEPGNYTLHITYIGYQDLTQPIEVTDGTVPLGNLTLQQGVALTEVEVIGKVLPVQQYGDTTAYNAAAYKTLPDASAEDLIQKMPTVVMSGGTIQAQGEDVKKVLVDGKPFFGDDPTAALRNLPAEVIEKVEIFDEQSEQAKLTGFADGETSKTINIVTKPNMQTGVFGSLYGGYGTEGVYKVGGNVNIFNGDQRITIMGLSNNINQQNFSTEDLLGVVGDSGGRTGGRGRPGGGGPGGPGGTSDFLVSQQGGITQSDALGINFSDQWGTDLSVTASYFYNRADNTSNQLLNQEFFGADTTSSFYNEQSLTRGINTNHRFNLKLDHDISERSSLSWNAKAAWQGNTGSQSVFAQTLSGSDWLTQTNNELQTDLSALNLSNDLTWKYKFDQPRRTLSVRLNTGWAPKIGDRSLLSESLYSDAAGAYSWLDQYATLDQRTWNASADVQYTEPLGEKSMLLLNYRASYQQQESNTETYDLDEASQDYDLLNDELSNTFSNDYVTQQAGVGLNWRSGDLSLMARTNLQWAELSNEQILPEAGVYNQNYVTVLPMANLRYKISSSANLNLSYRTSTNFPTVSQLQNVLDNSNPLQLSIGNPELTPAYQHRFNARYSKTSTENSSVFFAMLGADFTNNYIAGSTLLANDEDPLFADMDVAAGARLTMPVNLDGQWNIRSFMTYGFPIGFLGSNLNVDLMANLSQTPGMVSNELNTTDKKTAGIGLTLSSNISDKVDFTVSSRSNYNTVTNSLSPGVQTNYFNQDTRLKFDWVLGSGFVFRTDLNHQFYDGLSDEFAQNYLLWNMSIGKKVLKGDRGEISLSVFDLLDQNNSLVRNVTETYLEDVQTNVLQQYVMLSFKYDIRSF
ncbi:outer membrane beta-barrel protein [Flavilitoribacter nigricans]|uniref:Outer membrane protein beta-barrel domain-containing protein n=1 Tax=Flavilitoribacter nigricans (strain ATCC 23147 / DSM 23189 / NBRC 102662 / NCIMB 1420 / SS-2) TaxID=1122177 RepID=A0A2D0N906_FLAN2|nr:outer membrane beta-barrel protein [Flavilitoribacter nigricans]PHN04994.1 hypothetical protein CRP01_18360 [Flavilitoribacter nigricans DSM 23189 = NBRC 102662]